MVANEKNVPRINTDRKTEMKKERNVSAMGAGKMILTDRLSENKSTTVRGSFSLMKLLPFLSYPCSIRVSSVAKYLSVLLLTSALLDGTSASLASDALAPKRWRAVWRSDPTTSVTICWDTAAAGARHVVRLSAKGDDKPKVVEARRNGRYADGSGYFHQARVSGLTPGKNYWLTLHSDDASSDALRMRTSPKTDRPVTAVCFAGPPEGDAMLEVCRKAMASLGRATLQEESGTTGLLMVQCRESKDTASWSRWLDAYQQATKESGQLLPIVPVPGGMERGAYAELFGFENQEQAYFSLSFGKELSLIVLDTSSSMAGRQRAWLVDQLKQARREHRWVMVSYASAAFPAVARPSRARAHWVSVLEDYNVDLVFEAESRGYRRTANLRDHRVEAGGVVYLGIGSADADADRFEHRRWYLEPPAVMRRESGVARLRFSRKELAWNVTEKGGDEIDPIRIEPRK